MGDHESHICPSCGEEAPRLWDGEGFGFSFAAGGSSPANSGVTKHDYPTADYAVGMDSDKRWGEIQEREKVKQKVREKGGHRALIRRTNRDFIEYEAGSDKLIDVRKKLAREANQLVSKS